MDLDEYPNSHRINGPCAALGHAAWRGVALG